MRYRIAGLDIQLANIELALASLESLYDDFQRRSDAFVATGRNPHLCHARCSHCCRSGAFFGVSLIEALRLTRSIQDLPSELQITIREYASELFAWQTETFATENGSLDRPGSRDEAEFTARIANLNRRRHPTCPLLVDDLCSIYPGRPFLCRAYGYPVDAFSVESEQALVFRSLCHLYAGLSLTDYVRAKDLHAKLASISQQMTGGPNFGRFTSAEAILATLSVT